MPSVCRDTQTAQPARPNYEAGSDGSLRSLLRFQYRRTYFGSAQGMTRKRLDISRIAEIKNAARVPLTLHGGSGTDDEDLRKAIAAGVNVIHINTELRVAWRRGMEDAFRQEPDQVVPYKILLFAVES